MLKLMGKKKDTILRSNVAYLNIKGNCYLPTDGPGNHNVVAIGERTVSFIAMTFNTIKARVNSVTSIKKCVMKV